MNDLMGIIYTSKDDFALRELTAQRAVAALPVAGRYRMVDFVLSSLVNSGVKNVGVITQKNYHSLMDHLGSGKEWDLHTKNNGLFMLPPYLTRENGGEYAGVLDALRANVDYLRRSKQDYVLLTGSHTVYNTTFEDMFRQHLESGADITMLYAKCNGRQNDFSGHTANEHVFIGMDGDNWVTDMEINPNAPSYADFAMDVILIKKTLLMHLTDQALAHGQHALYGDMIRGYVKSGLLRIKGYEFTGYTKCVETVKSYYQFNMDLLNYDIRQELFSKYPVYTKVRDEVPAKYLPGAQVINSLVADGCVIEGTVENCILFRGVKVGKGTTVRNSIIMQDTDIEDGVELDNVILDKDVTIRSYGKLIGHTQYPIVIGKNVTL